MKLMTGLLVTFIAVIVIIIGNPFDIRDIVVEKIQSNQENAKSLDTSK